MSDHLVRVEQLKRLQAEHGWTDADLARHCKRQQQQIRSWWAYPGPGGRQIGEKLARSLEEELNLPRYSLDQRPGASATLPSREGSKASQKARPVEVARVAQHGIFVPVLSWEQLIDMLPLANAEMRSRAPVLETFVDVSQAAKFVTMPDESMEPVFGIGDHVLLDPALAPRAGDTVLVRNSRGDHFLRVFRPRTAHLWEAAALNPNFQALDSTSDGLVVVGVMVEHRRYRRR